MQINQYVRASWTTTNLVSGIEADADSLPTVVLRKNGITVATTPIVESKGDGEYYAYCLIDADDGWVVGDHYSLVASWQMSTQPKKMVLAQGIITNIDANIIQVGGSETPIDGKSLEAAIRYIAAILAGKASGAYTGEETFIGLDGSTVRLIATIDNNGNRTGMTYDP